jgi:hypothetical protein
MAQLNHNRPCFQKNLAKYVPLKQSIKLDPNHIGHDLVSIAAKKPHFGKLHCNSCNKFVKWVGESEFYQYKHPN